MKHALWLFILCLQVSATSFGQEARQQEINYDNIIGNPYLFKDWSDGVIRFTSGRTVTQFKLKFDCLKNQLLLQFDGSTFAAESKVREFVIYQKGGKNRDSIIFRKGYPAVDKATEETFYQVLFQGKVLLLKLISKNIIETKELVGGSVTRKLEEAESYYLLQNGSMIKLSLDKNELLQSLPEKSDQLSQYIASEQIRLRTADDLIKVIKKYNELL